MQLKIKIDDPRLLESSNQINYASQGAAAMDLRACAIVENGAVERLSRALTLYPGDEVMLSAGFGMTLPEGTAAMLLPRSGLGSKGLVLGNLVGLVDQDYLGLVKLSVWYRKDLIGSGPFLIEPMMRIAQMMIVPAYRPELEIVPALTETERGAGGFGSTGVA